MAKLKVYDTRPGPPMVTEEVGRLIGARRHVGQFIAYVTGYTKIEAMECLNEAGSPLQSSRDIRVGMGNTLEDLRAGGYFDEPGVVVLNDLDERGNFVILRRSEGYAPQVIGVKVRGSFDRPWVFSPIDPAD